MDEPKENEIQLPPELLLEELKLMEGKIQHFDSQLTSITQFGLPFVFTIIFAAMYLYDKSPLLSGLMLISGFFLVGSIGMLARKYARYLTVTAKHARNLEKQLGFRTNRIIKEERDKLKKEYGRIDRLLDPDNYRKIKWTLLISGLIVIFWNYWSGIMKFIKSLGLLGR